MTKSEKIRCKICDEECHHIEAHLRDDHLETSIEEYKINYPDAPLISNAFLIIAKRRSAERSLKMSAEVVRLNSKDTPIESSQDLHRVFDLGDSKAARNAKNQPIKCTVFSGHLKEIGDLVPDIDEKYIFDIAVLKKIHIGMEVGMPILLFGFHGTGKSTFGLQYCARTVRPCIRVQHTINTEESHIVGQWVVKKKETYFELGPLAVAMRDGLTYIADEYDIALPHVLSVYQPVLEGHALYIKEASPDKRIIRPHKNFRFIATGNTNGAGDDTGLYQGTQVQNAANYSRFQIALQIGYMNKKLETSVIMSQGGVTREDAEKIVEFGRAVRDAYATGEIQLTVSPRELITAAKLGLMTGADWKTGLQMAFINRLAAVDKDAVDSVAQRIFG